MVRFVIQGWAAVYREDEQVTDPAILRSLDGVVYDDERFTDYFGGPTEEDVVAAALEPGGSLQFGYSEGEELLTATTEYRSRRPLSPEELRLLVDYTMGQWSDGIGENWTCESGERCGYSIMCLGPWDFKDRVYPVVQVLEE
jgi:hypothetical protein